jgi:hypothetical protein
MRTSALVVLALAAASALADPPSPAEMAKIQHDVAKAQKEVDKKYEGRDLSPEEKKQQIKDRAAAENGVLDKAGVDRKDYARASAKMSKEDRAALANENEKLEKKEKAAGGSGQGGSKDVVIEKGGGGEKTPEEEAAEMDRAMGFGKGSGSKKKK